MYISLVFGQLLLCNYSLDIGMFHEVLTFLIAFGQVISSSDIMCFPS